MVVYECPRCGYTTSFFPNFKAHLQRKTLCDPKKENLTTEQMINFYDGLLEAKTLKKTYVCEYCKKAEFDSSQKKYRHKLQCPSSPSTSNTNANEIRQLKEEIGELKKQIASSSGPSVVNYNNNNYGTTINIVNMRAFGSENVSHIQQNKEFLASCLFDKDIPKLAQEIHGDTDHPENHNIRIFSHKKELIETMNHDNIWILAQKDEALGDMLNNCYRILREYGYYNKKEIIDTGDYDNDDYRNVMDWLEDVYDNEDVRKPIKDKLYVLLMNIERILKHKTAAIGIET